MDSWIMVSITRSLQTILSSNRISLRKLRVLKLSRAWQALETSNVKVNQLVMLVTTSRSVLVSKVRSFQWQRITIFKTFNGHLIHPRCRSWFRSAILSLMSLIRCVRCIPTTAQLGITYSRWIKTIADHYLSYRTNNVKDKVKLK